jgi:hemerythrin-like domain-containing protein
MSLHDLRGEAKVHLTGAALSAVRAVKPGSTVTLLLDAEPSLLMKSLNLQLRENLAWEVKVAEQGWSVTVRHREDVAARDVLALLAADHKQIDGLLAAALAALNCGDLAAALPLLQRFAMALKRHVAFEDGELAQAMGAARAPADAPPAVMLREHGEIAQQLALVEETLAIEPPDASELAVYCAILSGTLAKHEYREEQQLFPLWQAQLLRRDAAERRRLLERGQAAIAAVNTD